MRDLGAARSYIVLDNPTAALQQMEYIFDSVEILLRFPESGRLGRRRGTREFVISRTPFIVAYRVRGDTIELLRVLHGRQRWPETL